MLSPHKECYCPRCDNNHHDNQQKRFLLQKLSPYEDFEENAKFLVGSHYTHAMLDNEFDGIIKLLKQIVPPNLLCYYDKDQIFYKKHNKNLIRDYRAKLFIELLLSHVVDKAQSIHDNFTEGKNADEVNWKKKKAKLNQKLRLLKNIRQDGTKERNILINKLSVQFK